MPLQLKFLSQLDLHCDDLVKIFQKRGGHTARKLQSVVSKGAPLPVLEVNLLVFFNAFIPGMTWRFNPQPFSTHACLSLPVVW